jgi:hypothetical protein
MGFKTLLVAALTLNAISWCFSSTVPPFPLQEVVKDATIALSSAPQPQPIAYNSSTYLDTINGIVQFFAKYQLADGSIVDPYDKRERYYSTPCYAFSAAQLYVTGYNRNLLHSASTALTNSLQQLARGQCCDNMCHFFVMPSILAYSVLKDHIKNETLLKEWQSLASSVDPYSVYSYKNNSWDIAALTGEVSGLRHSIETLSLIQVTILIETYMP